VIPRKYSSEAIVLSRKNYSEADRIIVIYTKHYGKITIIGKGVRKPKSKKRSSIEVFSKIKFSAARTKGFDILTEVELIDFYKNVRTDLKKVSVAYFFVETVNKLTQDGEKNDEIYNLLVKYLDSLKRSAVLKKLRHMFISEILILLGFWPKDKILANPDKVLENVVEREMTSVRVGKKVLQK
jgi:DNA repair protein RecO (recombination protein O)